MFPHQQNGRRYTTIEEKEEGDDTVEIVLNSERAETLTDKPSFDFDRVLGGGLRNAACCGSDCFLSRWYYTLTFGFLNPLLKTGNERPLEMDDLYPLDPADTAFSIFNTFTEAWNRFRAESNFPLFRAFTSAFGGPFFNAGFLKLIHDICLFAGPQLLKAIIQYLSDPHASLSKGLLFVLGLFLANLTMSLCLRQYFYLCYLTGMRLRSAVVTSTYQKALVLSSGAKRQKTTGEITNLMSIDAQRMQDLTPYLHAVWYSLFQIGVALFFLWMELGPACLGGIGVTILMIPVTAMVAKRMKLLQSQLMRVKDERVKVNTEVLGGMKVIKLQAWEQSYQERIEELREREMQLFKQYIIIRAVSGTMWASTPLLVALATFTVYVNLGHELDVATALTSLALFDILRFPLFMLPQVINNLVEAKVSVTRIEEFLLSPERVPVPTGPKNKKGVNIHKAYFIWEGKRVLNDQIAATYNPLQIQNQDSPANGTSPSAGQLRRRTSRRYQRVANDTGEASAEEEMDEQEWESVLLQAQLQDYGMYIDDLESEVQLLRRQQSVLNPRLSELGESAMMEPVSGSETSDTPRNSSFMLSVGDAPSDLRSILTLRRVDFDATMGELIAVVGLVGTGKSSLIASMLGDLRLLSGGISVCGKVAYVGQRPFIQNATLRQNICFGLPFDRERYLEVLDACAMVPDLKVLPAGDRTEIGEKGINLSGGQKARVALARAVYANADVYLLDDPLAAVDSHVGKHLFEKCIEKLLRGRGKCVVLVTNAFHVLPSVNRVMVMSNGCVVETGSYDYLMERGTHFRRLMQSFQSTIQASEEEESTSAALLDDAQLAEALEVSGEVRARVDSITEEKSLDDIIGPDDGVDDDTGRLIKNEDREVGSVSMTVYGKWVSAAGGMQVAVIGLTLYAIAQIATVLTQWWLSYWSANRHTRTAYFFLGIYGAINVASMIVILVRELYMCIKSWSAGRTMFRELLDTVMHAPMSFFDTTPIGRVINRFSKDIYTTDEQIPQTMRSYLGTITAVVSVVLVICVVTPLFLVALVPIVGFYAYSQHYYIKTSRELKRLDSITRSPIFALFGETLEGATTIRAYSAEERFFERNASLLDKNQQAYFLTFAGNCWLAVRLELVGTLIVTFAALFAVLAQERAGPEFAGMAGLAISLALSVTQSLNWSVRMASDLEAQMVAVERVSEYARMPIERPHFIPANDPSPEWSQDGAIEMNNVSLRYRPGLPLVLKSVTLSIPARCKLGIVGRTGAGKSSMVLALLRLVEIESGTVHIDGVNVANIGLHALRSKVTVIPQDPVLFSGTVRSNIDPFKQFTDAQLWDGLRRTRLDNRVKTLDDAVEENGANFSVGQRQLLCISRALLSGARIIIMDEATAAVDVETDALIQTSIRVEFSDCTCLTIAHRLNTIMDSTKVLVLEQGRVAEYDSPSNLLSDPRSMFSELVNNWEAGNDT